MSNIFTTFFLRFYAELFYNVSVCIIPHFLEEIFLSQLVIIGAIGAVGKDMVCCANQSYSI